MTALHGGVFTALLWVCALAANAAEPPVNLPSPAGFPPERIGLVLGGGGARGAAHIGILKVLERERIPIHAIAGTSVGAIIGALYATGYSPEEIERNIGSLDWADLFRDETGRELSPMRQKETDLGNLANVEIGVANGRLNFPNNMVRGQKIDLLLRSWFLAHSAMRSFDDLPIPFRCVATDIGVVKPVVFSSGDLALAVRASVAVPGAFAPVHSEGRVLVDGGIVNNVPIDLVRAMGVDRVIVVDVSAPLEPAEEVSTGAEILLQVITGLIMARTEQQLADISPRDLLVRPELGDLGSAGFRDVLKGIALGEQAALAVVDELRSFSVPEAQYLVWQHTQRIAAPAAPVISFVRVNDVSSRTAEYVRDRISQKLGKPLDREALERDIANAYGRGTYQSINYQIATDKNGRTGLDVTPVDSTLGRLVFRGGIQISDDFAGSNHYQVNLETRLTGLTEKGGEWRLLGGIGRVTRLASDLYLPFGELGSWYVAPSAGYSLMDQLVLLGNQTVAEYRVGSWLGAVQVGRDFGDNFRISTGVLRGRDHADRQTADPLLPGVVTADIGGLNATLLWDSLDNVRFPRHGTRAEISFTNYQRGLGSDFDANQLRVSIDKAFEFGPSTLMLGGRASVTDDEAQAFQTQSFLGGLTFLSGIPEYELVGNQMLLLRSVFYRRLTRQGLLFDLPVYIAGSLEGGNVWGNRSQVSLKDLIGATSVFLGVDLPIGPLQFGYGRTFDGRDSLYLTFGSLVLPHYR